MYWPTLHPVIWSSADKSSGAAHTRDCFLLLVKYLVPSCHRQNLDLRNWCRRTGSFAGLKDQNQQYEQDRDRDDGCADDDNLLNFLKAVTLKPALGLHFLYIRLPCCYYHVFNWDGNDCFWFTFCDRSWFSTPQWVELVHLGCVVWLGWLVHLGWLLHLVLWLVLYWIYQHWDHSGHKLFAFTENKIIDLESQIWKEGLIL